MERAQASRIVLVLGMHRSGTSALAGALTLLGAEMPGELMPPAAGNNEKGFFESQALFRFHEELLHDAGSAWDDMLPMPAGYFASAQGLARRAELTALLARDYAALPLTAVKDPRICRLMPLWRPAMADAGLEPLVVMPLRDPVEVALSLQARNGFDLSRGLLLWLRHVLSAERETRDLRRVTTTYDGLLADWHGTLTAVGRSLGIRFPHELDASAAAITAFLDRDLKHNLGGSAPGQSAGVPADIRETWAALLSLASGEDEAAARAILDRIGSRLDDATGLYGGYADEARRALRHADDRLHAASTEAQHMRGRHAAAQAEADSALRDAAAIRNSTIWRLSAPLRMAIERVRGRPVPAPVTDDAAPARAYAVSIVEGDDVSFDVPIAGAEDPGPAASICVVAHLHYPDLAPEILRALAHIPGRFDLFVSTPAAAEGEVAAALAGWDRGRATVKAVENRGRDIAHKLITFRDVYANYRIVLFVHTKKSPHDPELAPWRAFLLENLVGSRDVARTNLALLEANPWLGIVASQHFGPIRPWVNWGNAFDIASGLASRMGIALDREAPLDFPSGSMFWARTAALRPLLDLDLAFADFEEESGQAGDTLAHAVERLFFHACEKAGFGWIKVARPELLAGLSVERGEIAADGGSFRLSPPARPPLAGAGTVPAAPIDAGRQGSDAPEGGGLGAATDLRVANAMIAELQTSQAALTLALGEERRAALALIRDMEALRASTSWRLTAPLRKAVMLLRRR